MSGPVLICACSTLIVLLGGAVRADAEAEPRRRPEQQCQGRTGEKEPARRTPSGIVISKETTFVTEPLTDKGFVDYIAALNRHASRGVTPENNAVVAMVQALGPKVILPNIRPRYFELLGITAPPERGDYFVPLDEFVKRSDGEDAEAAFTKAHKQLDAAMDRPWSRQEFPLLADWLAANDKPLDLVVQALEKRRRYYEPYCTDGILVSGTLLGVPHEFRPLARALVARAMHALRTEKIEDATRDLLAVHRLARLTTQGATAIEGLVGVSLETMAISGDQRLLSYGKLSSRQALDYRNKLNALPPMEPMVEKIDFAERITFIDTVQYFSRTRSRPEAFKLLNEFSFQPAAPDRAFNTIAARSDAGGPVFAGVERVNAVEAWHAAARQNDEPAPALLMPVSWSAGSDDRSRKPAESSVRSAIDWNIVMRMGNNWFDRVVAAARQPNRARRYEQLGRIEREMKDLRASVWERLIDMLKEDVLKEPGSPRAVSREFGNLMLVLMAPAVTQPIKAEERAQMKAALNELTFALAAYKSDRGRYPDNLDRLTPKYAEKIPRDVYSGESPIYRRTDDGYLLYSVGPNGKDEAQTETPPIDDIVVRTQKKPGD